MKEQEKEHIGYYSKCVCVCVGHLLDSFARAALWESGLDYLHGTGHGVGCFLNVHEGPCGISYKTFADEPLEAGMILSDGTHMCERTRAHTHHGYRHEHSFAVLSYFPVCN